MRFRDRVDAVGLQLLVSLARWLPRRSVLSAGALAGEVGRWLDHRHRRIALDNLRCALGERVGERERRRLARVCWRHFGRIAADTLTFSRLSARDVGRSVHYEGLDHLRRAYDRGRGVLVFSGHFGHWELMAQMQGHLGMPLALLARPLDRPRIEAWLNQVRCGSGNTVVHKRRAVREMLRVLRAGGAVAMLIDQDARKGGVFVPFFGRPASTTPTLALLALRTGAAIVPVFATSAAGGRYRIVYDPPVDVRRTEDRSADVVRLTAQCTAILEDRIRRSPEMWLWMHRRWKTPPPGSAAVSGAAAPDADR